VLFQTAILFNISTPAQNKTNTSTNWPELVFEHLTIADGLPENSVRCILQDHLGYMWFGTQGGLVRYDGYTMKVYRHDSKDSLSISDDQIFSIYEDESGILWIGTQYGGLNCFDRATETFTRYNKNQHKSSLLDIKFILSIIEDNNGNILIGAEGGLFLVDRRTEIFTYIKLHDNNNTTPIDYRVWAIIKDRLTNNIYVGSRNKLLVYDSEKQLLVKYRNMESDYKLGTIRSFYQAVDGTIWISNSNGLAKFNSLNNTLEYYQPHPSLEPKIENRIWQLTEDNGGFIWGSGDGGLVCFDKQFEQFKLFKNNPENQSSLSTSIVWSVYNDRSGVLWVGTGWEGMNKWDRKKQKFKRFSFDPSDPENKNFGIVHSIMENRKGIIWFGTDHGLNSFNRFSNEFRNYKFGKRDKSNTATYICEDEFGLIWFGTYEKGLGKFNTISGSVNFYSNIPNDSTSISNNNVRFILPDNNDVLWVGTWGGGLNKFNKKTGKFMRFRLFPYPSDNQISCIYKDQKGGLWVGTDDDGLNELNRAYETLKSYDLGRTPSPPSITTIYDDKKGNFWVGTYGDGIHLVDQEKVTSVNNFTEKDGLANNYVRSILEDDSGSLWIGTNNGISKFDPITHNIKNYFTQDGSNENSYKYNACKTSTGEMLFGTSDGFIMFNPDSIKVDPVPPQVVISNVSLFNELGKKLEFDGFISELKELDLSYDENDLRFDYVGLHFSEPGKNQYKYMLENFDKDWIDAGTQRNATYTNLDPGEYDFRVTACNADGVWNKKGASLKIIIATPFWATWWAYGFYLIFLGSILYGIRKYEMNRQLWKHRMELETVEAVKYKEINRMKSHFFANISHEFRTPLTLILGPSENILTEAPSENTIKQAGTIKRNANRLLLLINQLLDLSKLEAGKLELKASKDNIVSFIKGFTMSFESLAEGKDITLKVSAEKEQIELYFDKEKMIKIMSNLLSNAFKFTPEGGRISVTIGENNHNSIDIKVRNNGTGVVKEKLSKLFDRFYQVDDSNTREHEGTGIGLALVKELVELHQGTISVDSEPGDPDKMETSWTEFIIHLPLDRKHLRNYEIIEDEVPTDEAFQSYAESGAMNLNEFDILDSLRQKDGQASQAPANDVETHEDKTLILVVEDNADVREFIKDSLSNGFQIQEASNGEQGVKKAEQLIPDLIISDIMMPKMDGNELTRILKNNEKTSHIPIILLTAKSEQQSKLEGLKTGADDYLTKPFDTKELQIRINNLISIRRKLQQRYSSVDYVPSKNKKETEWKLTNLEEQFMSKVMEVIENHLSEEEFSIEQFGEEVGMSRMQLHRKLKALTGKSASNYLRSVRLNKAKKMIEEKTGSISEIAYSVGFSSPQYFTRSFKEEFGYPPSELL
jgi:signal transduction histidine kinase/ligand-binding sensor domain-containing protein/DNA-binding response OmpR family regulator